MGDIHQRTDGGDMRCLGQEGAGLAVAGGADAFRGAGTKPSARYDSPIPDFKSQLGYAQDLGRGPLLTGQ